MKNYLYLLLVLVGVCYCLDDSEGSEDYWHHRATHDEHDHSPIVRPCSPYDMKCIRHFFARHSHCSVRHGPVPDPLYTDRATLPFPIINITYTLNNIEIKGLDSGKITEFYVNKETDNLVLAVEVPALTIYSRNSQAKYYRKAKEPIVLMDYTIVTFKNVIFTITIPNINNLKLSRADVFTYLTESNPKYTIGQKAIPTKDPEAVKAHAALVTSIPSVIMESFMLQGSVHMTVYIQNNICDFGLPVYSY